MPTIIDSLLVTLGLDSAKFDEGAKRAGKSTDEIKAKAKELEKANKEARDSVDGVTAGFIKFFGIIGSAYELKNLIEHTVQASDKYYLLSQNLAESAGRLNAWSNVADAAGGSASGLQGTLHMLSKSATEFQITGSTGILKFTQQLGVGLLDASGKARSSIDILRDVGNELLARSGGDRNKAFNVGSMMGIDVGTLNLLLQGGNALDKMLEKQKAMLPITDKQAKEARDLKQAYTEMSQSFDAGGRQLVSFVYPALMKFAAWMTDVNEWVNRNGDKIQQYLPLVGVLAATYFTPAIVSATLAFLRLTAAFLLSPVGIVTALAGAIYLLWEDYQTWKKGGDSLIDWGKWKPSIDAAIEGIGRLRDIIKETFGYLNQAGSWLGGKTFDVVQSVSGGVSNAKQSISGWMGKLADAVGLGESGGNYNAYNTGTKGVAGGRVGYSGEKDLANMTLDQMQATESLSGNNRDRIFAAGKYQMTPAFIRDAMQRMGLSGNEKFTPELQDAMFAEMMPQVAKDYMSGKSGASLQDAQAAIAKMYRSIEDPLTGRTYADSGASANASNSLASSAASNALQQARAANTQTSNTNNTQTVTTHVDNVTINTAATNASDIAANFHQEMQKRGQMVYSADGGLN